MTRTSDPAGVTPWNDRPRNPTGKLTPWGTTAPAGGCASTVTLVSRAPPSAVSVTGRSSTASGMVTTGVAVSLTVTLALAAVTDEPGIGSAAARVSVPAAVAVT